MFRPPGGRSEAYTVIEINMMQGQELEAKKAPVKRLFAEIDKQFGIKPVDIEIIIKEQPAHYWVFSGITGDKALIIKSTRTFYHRPCRLYSFSKVLYCANPSLKPWMNSE